MKKIHSTGDLLKQNYRELSLVIVAFSLMVLVAGFSIGRILENRLMSRANEMIATIEANVRAGLSEAESTLLNSYYTIQTMLLRNASNDEIMDYLVTTSDWLQRRTRGLLGFYGVYAYINGELLNGMGTDFGDDYILQSRPWFQTAMISGTDVAFTVPYEDIVTGDIVITAVRNIDVNGVIVGILALDIDITWLTEYAASLSLTEDGYGMLLSQNMTFMAHPNKQFMGRHLGELGGHYVEIAYILRDGGEIFGRRIRDENNRLVIIFFARIFNGWFAGILTPYHQFYSDLYVASLILAALGITFSIALCFVLLRLSRAKALADKESKSKTSFLANMSHEIRTPMNAITGMAEILLRGDLSEEARGYALDIKQAGSNLISIINDILDFSKIEAGKLEIHPARYLFSSIINDSINIIRARLMDKPVKFFTNIDSCIPNCLYGDEVRLRQIILNLLSNAVKYSERGSISLTITSEKRDVLAAKEVSIPNERIWLKIVVSDTGCGIKPEDLDKLFNEFTQVNLRKDKAIEGTGLGLAITKRLCTLMGGSIKAESEFGKGSTFTVSIPQGVCTEEFIASVEDASNKKVLIYERRAVYADSLCWSLKNLNVPHYLALNIDTFIEALNREEWNFIFLSFGLYDKVKQAMENTEFTNGKQPDLTLMVEWGIETTIPNVRYMFLPVQSISIANILNGITDGKDFYSAYDITTIRFTLPEVKILVVDDVSTNLKVAEGLLAPYCAEVESCLSGAEAVELIKHKKYDLIFMDHMMPEMDGIEAVSVIREWEHENEMDDGNIIIALTANAVMGMREMFMKNGFDDFLAKPIDVSKLDEILDYWIPADKKNWDVEKKETADKHNDTSIFNIPGVDTNKGMHKTGGTKENYRKVLLMFCKDALERIPALQTPVTEENISLFVTQVHALKSASATIGSQEVSSLAAALETAGKTSDMAFIEKHTIEFVKYLEELVNNIQTVLDAETPEPLNNESSMQTGESSAHLLKELVHFLAIQDVIEIDRKLEEIGKKDLDLKTKVVLEKITGDILIAEYENAIQSINELLADDK